MSKFSSRDLTVVIKNESINKLIENLHIKASISKTLAGVPNTAELQIWNLNQNSREDLYNNVYNLETDEANTTIEVTLDDKVLFQGDLINTNNVQSQSESEWVTNLYCGDGLNAYRKKINKKYSKGTTRKEIVDDLIGELESTGAIVKGFVSELKGCTDKSLLKAIVVNGEIMKNIKDVLSNCLGGTANDEDVYIDDGKINIVKKSTVINNKIIINKGLLELPTLTEQGVNCKTLIDPSLKIGAEFEVDAKSNNIAYGNLTQYRVQKARISGTGTYKIQEIRHNIDNFTDEVASSEIVGLNIGNLRD